LKAPFFGCWPLLCDSWTLRLASEVIYICLRLSSKDWPLNSRQSTKGIRQVEHVKEENSKGPHIHLIPVHLWIRKAFVAFCSFNSLLINLWSHILLGSQDSSLDIFCFLGKAKISYLENLHKGCLTF
jgi:hypothetical protein